MSPPRGGRKGGKGRRKGTPPRYRKQQKADERRARKNRQADAPSPPESSRRDASTVASPSAMPGPAMSPRLPGTVVSLDPLAPIIVRSGRPFDDQASADPARFPPPSTVAGCLRTAWARERGKPFEPTLARVSVAGPLLLARDDRVLAPKPADALYFGQNALARCVRTQPCAFDDDGGGADLPDGLLPVQLTERIVGKPGPGPAWWSWNDLLEFRGGRDVEHANLCTNGWSPPPGDRRTHVAVNPATGAAQEGKLFQTEGLDLDAPDEGAVGAAKGGLRFLARCDEVLGEALVHLGGERRLAALRPESETTWPTPPEGWLDGIAEAGGLCLTLLTPGIFSWGYRPSWLDAALTGRPPGVPALELKLRAVAVDRWQPHSGWDLAKSRPRPTRKLAPAGTTYWFSILAGADTKTLEPLWLASVCDDDQDRRDGFGLALPSPWLPSP